ncbi:DUF3052 family protein [uncultured Leifsonia sp.]|uniref:DUF3052 family protein n=1 Tax=uncultured Leifsonia sp. TaxID=340359 RepID=UPI0025F1D502|nr:DUF3052 family protein [uncultured Leifsonia sp.]
MSAAVGYSGTPLWKKLGLKPAMRAQLLHADPGWSVPVEDGPSDVEWLPPGSTEPAGMIVAFFREAAEYLDEVDGLAARIHPAGMIWAAWPRKAAGHVSDLDENVIRDTALARGLVDVKVAALSSDWSALKLVVRRTNR